jgi:hypothetical protein
MAWWAVNGFGVQRSRIGDPNSFMGRITFSPSSTGPA